MEPLPPGHLLVLRPRRPDPTPPARTLPPSRARRSRGRSSTRLLLGATGLLAAALLLVAQSAAATQASYQISGLKQEQARLTGEGDELRAQLAHARAARRIDAAAQAMGLDHPARWQYLSEARSPIALTPRRTDTARGGLLAGVLATLGGVIGHPVDAEARSD